MIRIDTTPEAIGELNKTHYQMGACKVFEILHRMIIEQGISKGRAFERATKLLNGPNCRMVPKKGKK